MNATFSIHGEREREGEEGERERIERFMEHTERDKDGDKGEERI